MSRTLGHIVNGKRSVLVTALVAALAWLAACAGDQASTGPVAPREGLSPAAITATRYALHRLDGSSLPRRICPGEPERITAAMIVLRSNGTFRVVIRYRTSADSPMTEVRANGTYTVNGRTVTFRGSNGITVMGTLSEAGARLAVRFSYCTPVTSHNAVFLRQ